MGVSSFSKIRTTGTRYVDKTGHIKKLLEKGSKFFLSRPRRFGKSLFLSMLESFFRMEIGLFKNLQVSLDPPEISPKYPGKVWGDDLGPFPVIKLDLSGMDPESLQASMIDEMASIGKRYGVDINTNDVSSAINSLVRLLAGVDGNDYGQVVVLVDEYDSPIISSMFGTGTPRDAKRMNSTAEASIKILANFFGTLKKLDDFIVFRFVTGVTKVAHTLLFSTGSDMEVRILMTL